jgi:hypothetical protein
MEPAVLMQDTRHLSFGNHGCDIPDPIRFFEQSRATNAKSRIGQIQTGISLLPPRNRNRKKMPPMTEIIAKC